MATQQQISEIIKELAEFNVNKDGNTLENLTRYNAYIPLFVVSFDSQKENELWKEACNLSNLIYNFGKKNKKTSNEALVILFTNELNRRQGKPIKGIQFPKFIEKTKVINRLIECCKFLIYDTPDFVEPHLENSYNLARKEARKTIEKNLNRALTTIYSNNISE